MLQKIAALWKYSGIFLAATGVLHCIGLFVFGRDILSAAQGYFDSRTFFLFVYWVTVSGIVLVVFGHTPHWCITKEQQPAPRFVGYWLLGPAAAGCLVAPVSGFLLLIPQGLIIVPAQRNASHRKGSAA
jgi:hypothetical protein